MKYIEVAFDLSQTEEPMREIIEQVFSYELGEIGFESFIRSEDGMQLLTYVAVDKWDDSALQGVLDMLFEQYGSLPYSRQEIEDKDWNEEWEKHYFRPVEVIPGEVVVRASFHESVEGVATEIIIDPKMAFGTGNHATTAGMMQLIGALDLSGKQVIDMGCGSGILGIYAMKKGAAACTSVDIDPWSVENAEQNAVINGVTPEVRLGDASILPTCPKADLFLANINRNIILNDLAYYLDRIKEDGDILLSGFLKSDIMIITEALSAAGWQVVSHLNPNGDWVALRARKA